MSLSGMYVEMRRIKKFWRQNKIQIFDLWKQEDLYFLMGHTLRYHTWIIIGLFYPEKKKVFRKSFFICRINILIIK